MHDAFPWAPAARSEQIGADEPPDRGRLPSPRRRSPIRPKHLYLALCAPGALLPLSQLVPFVREHGLDVRLLFAQLWATHAGAFFGLDVIVSSVVLWVLVYVEGRRAGVRHRWAPIVANFVVGVSLGLPLFLYLRERSSRAGSRLTAHG